VCDLVDHGHAVLFDSTGSYAVNKKTGVKTAFLRQGKDWNLRLTLEAPQKANEVMGQILAEMRELRAQAVEPDVTLQFASGLVPSLACVGKPRKENAVESLVKFFERPQKDNRVEPLFRGAVRE
jgi:hypothetical protein